jgi:hypothetical protein
MRCRVSKSLLSFLVPALNLVEIVETLHGPVHGVHLALFDGPVPAGPYVLDLFADLVQCPLLSPAL